MSRLMNGLREWASPGSVVRPSVPPMDAGLRPNDLLDEASSLLPVGDHEPEDVVLRSDGQIWFSSGTAVWSLRASGAHVVADLGAPVGALAVHGDEVVAAVEGHGLVQIAGDGGVVDRCTDAVVRSCVTDVAVVSDHDLVVSVGSRHTDTSGWARALLDGDHSGALVTVGTAGATSVAEGLAWPAGVAVGGNDEALISLAFDYRIERRPLARLGQPGNIVLRNLPFYPGRIRAGRDGWWVAAPFVRNRATELILDEPALCRDLVAVVGEGEWPVPRLRPENPYREPMQMGQLRVLGVLKPWAPARSYGLVLFLGRDGRVQRSYHSRVDGDRHGITGVAERDGRVVVAARGARSLLDLGELQR